MGFSVFGTILLVLLMLVFAGLAVVGIILSCTLPRKKGMKPNLTLVFMIAAFALDIIAEILFIIFIRTSFHARVNFPNLKFVISTLISLIIPVFAIISRRAAAVRKPFAIAAFVFAGIQVLFALLTPLLRWGMFTDLNPYLNGTNMLRQLGYIFDGDGFLIVMAYFFWFISAGLYIAKNIVGGVSMLGSPNAPQYAAPQYAAPQYAAPQYAAPQYAAPQTTVKNGKVYFNGVPYKPGFEPHAPQQDRTAL